MGLAILAFGFTITSMGTTGADGGGVRGSDVRVINTTAEPVPTVAQGTTNIAGSVTLNGTPNVNLTSGATVGIASSANTVKIDSSNPVLIRDIDNPARQPFSDTLVFGENSSAVLTVPDGKRLVIEYITAECFVDPGRTIVIFANAHLGSFTTSHIIPMTSHGPDNFGASENLTVSQPVKFYADQFVEFRARKNEIIAGPVSPQVYLTVSGYLVNIR